MPSRGDKAAVALGLFAAETALAAYGTYRGDTDKKLNFWKYMSTGCIVALAWNAAVMPPAWTLLYATR